MNAETARQALMRVWDHLRRAGIRDWGRPWRWDVKGRAEVEEAATTREGQTSRVVEHRRRFWAEFREGQRQADARAPSRIVPDP